MDIFKNRSARIYVGPSLPGGVLPQFTVFRGKLPAYVADLMGKSPSLRHLIVPVSRLSQARRDLSTNGNLLNLYAAKVRKEVRGE